MANIKQYKKYGHTMRSIKFNVYPKKIFSIARRKSEMDITDLPCRPILNECPAGDLMQ
jgi:hypothetical protein